jgi:hypothetical protein
MAKEHSSIKSSTKLFNSLASKASVTLKSIKRKAVKILSPKKKKRAKCIPDGDGDSSTDTDGPGSQPPSEKSSHHSNRSIIEIPDEEDPEDELSE